MTFEYDSRSYHLVSYHLNRAYILFISHRISSRLTSSHFIMSLPIVSHHVLSHLISSRFIPS